MRIGTWNLAGRWDARHLALIQEMDCDVLLLTEVSSRVALPNHDLHLGNLLMAPKRRWAAVASRLPMRPMPDPHGATAMVELGGLRFCSSILPWRGCGIQEPWVGANTAEKTISAVADVEAAAPTIWDGDWNHALSGREWAGSIAGRLSVLDTVERLGLQAPTAASPHQIEDLLSIDHIAVPKSWVVGETHRHRAFVGETRISDHDACVVKGSAGRASRSRTATDRLRSIAVIGRDPDRSPGRLGADPHLPCPRFPGRLPEGYPATVARG